MKVNRIAPNQRNHRTLRHRVVAVVAIAAAGLAAACGTGATQASSAPGGPPAQSSVLTATGQTHYPVTLTDCLGTHTYDRAPSRIVSLDDWATDTLIALGLTDKLVAVTKFETPGQEWSQDADTVAKLPGLTLGKGGGYPSVESILPRRPDFVVSVITGAFSSGSGPATQQRWQSLGVASYAAINVCGVSIAKPLTNFDKLYTDIHNLGVIFNVQANAARLIQHLQAEIGADQALIRKAGLRTYRIGEADGTTTSAGTLGVGTANAIIDQAGSTYAFAHSTTNPNVDVSWEQVVAANPEVLWLVTDTGHTVPQIERFLENDPQLRTVRAIQRHAYVPLSFFAAGGSPRAVDGVRQLVDGLVQLKRDGKI